MWIKRNYPNVLYTIDLAGMSLTKAQRMVHATRCKKGHPDMMFQEWMGNQYCGLAIEFKRTDEKITLKDGSIITAGKKGAHLQQQLHYITELRNRYWVAGFVVGIDDAKKVIKAYLEGGPDSLKIINSIMLPKMNLK